MSDLEQEIKDLKKENKKLSIESKLRKSMAVELDRQKELLRQFDEATQKQGQKHSPKAYSWVNEVKDFISKAFVKDN